MSQEELQHLLKLISLEYEAVNQHQENIEKFIKRIESIVGADEAARLVSSIFANDPEKTQPLSEDKDK